MAAIANGPKTEAEWRARSDANTLAEAKVIAADPARFKAAQGAAVRQAEELAEQAKELNVVAGKMRSLASAGKPTFSPVATPPAGTPSGAKAPRTSGTAPAEIPVTKLTKK